VSGLPSVIRTAETSGRASRAWTASRASRSAAVREGIVAGLDRYGSFGDSLKPEVTADAERNGAARSGARGLGAAARGSAGSPPPRRQERLARLLGRPKMRRRTSSSARSGSRLAMVASGRAVAPTR
jgi:hypothetical protein